jgi:hypothetical protein
MSVVDCAMANGFPVWEGRLYFIGVRACVCVCDGGGEVAVWL